MNTLATRITFCIITLLFVGAGCARSTTARRPRAATSPIANPEPTSSSIQEFTSDDATIVTRAISASLIPREMPRPLRWNVPTSIAPEQFRSAYLLTETMGFGLIQQANSNIELMNDDGTFYERPVSFAGILFTSDDGRTWKRAFSIPTSTARDEHGLPIHMNVVGLSLRNNTYILDIADDRGAGSGEGNMARFHTTTGRTWTRDSACYMFIPEEYYKKDATLKTTPCPSYMMQLRGMTR